MSYLTTMPTTLHKCVDPTIINIQYLKVYLIIICMHVEYGYLTILATVKHLVQTRQSSVM